MPRPASQPTGHKLASTTLQSVVDRIDAGLNNSQIYRETGVMRRHIARFRQNLKYWSQPYPSECVKIGRLSTLRELHRRRMRLYLEGRPQAYLEEIRDWFIDEFDMPVSTSVIHREL
jgi:hypothetical protein